MSTLKPTEANRRNAAKSTGPRTTEGKDASRLNALKHGVYANAPVIMGESRDHYEALSRSHFERFNPATPEEHTLVAILVRNAWLLERFSNVETDLWNSRLEHLATYEEDNLHALGDTAGFHSSRLRDLQRRIDSADRSYRRNLELLMMLQSQRTQTVTAPNGFVPPKPVARPPRPAPPPLAPPFLMKSEAAAQRVSIEDSQIP